MLKTVSSITNAIGALNYIGTWNATTNTPALASGVGTKGDYYVVSVAGSTNLNGETLWGIGDWAIYNGAAWQKLEGGNTINATTVSASTSVTTPIIQATSGTGGTIKNNSGTTQLQWGTSGGSNLSLVVATNINPTNAAVNISPTGTGTVTISPVGALTINPTAVSTMNNVSIGATTPSTVAATTIAASGVSTFSAGAVGTPSITTTGDTNTGMFFPAADTIAFAEGGVEAMRINSSANLGIGTGSPTARLCISGNQSFVERTDAYIGVDVATVGGNGGSLTVKAGAGTGSGNLAGNLLLGAGRGNTSASTGYIAFGTAKGTNIVGLDAEYMRIFNTGGVSIGNTTDRGAASLNVSGLIFPQQAATAPTYVKGAIYFDTTLNKLRVGGATGWETITSI